MRFAVLLLVAAGALTAAPVPKDMKAKKGDAALLVGRWKPSDGTTQWYEFKADGTMKTWNEPGEANAVPYLWTIDPTAKPKRMTWSNAKSGRAEWEAVYELDGDDLKMTYAATPKVPPAIGPGPGLFVNGQTRANSDR